MSIDRTDGHDWQPNGTGRAGASCADCGENIHNGNKPARCSAPAALQRRLAALAATARDLGLDLRAARDAAEPGEKAAYRYPLRQLEQATALIERAAK